MYPDELPGDDLVLRPWNDVLLRQVAAWSERGFPYHAFDMGKLKAPAEAARMLAFAHQPGPHRHFIAVEDGIAVGRLSVNLRDEAGLYIWGVHVPEEYGRRGVCRRMLAALVRWLETAYPRPEGFILSSNAFATHAHRAYRAVGFDTTDTRWHFDREIADGLTAATPEQRAIVNPYIRYDRGRWEVSIHVMRRPLHWRQPVPPEASVPARG